MDTETSEMRISENDWLELFGSKEIPGGTTSVELAEILNKNPSWISKSLRAWIKAGKVVYVGKVTRTKIDGSLSMVPAYKVAKKL